MDILEYICDGSQYHPSINRRGERYKIRDCLKQSQAEQKGELLSTRNMGKGLHKLFKAVVNDISQELPIQVESGSEFSYLISGYRKFSEVNRLSEDIRKPCLKATMKDITNIINSQTF